MIYDSTDAHPSVDFSRTKESNHGDQIICRPLACDRHPITSCAAPSSVCHCDECNPVNHRIKRQGLQGEGALRPLRLSDGAHRLERDERSRALPSEIHWPGSPPLLADRLSTPGVLRRTGANVIF